MKKQLHKHAEDDEKILFKKNQKLLINNLFNYSKDNDESINNILINKFEVQYKKNIKVIDKQIKIIDLDYIDFFYYKLSIIKNIDFFKGYINKNMLKKQV